MRYLHWRYRTHKGCAYIIIISGTILFIGFPTLLDSFDLTGSTPQVEPRFSESGEDEILFSADRTEAFLVKEALIKKYIGNVSATYKDIILKANQGTYYQAQKRIEFVGNASIEDPSGRISADSIVYLTDLQKAIANGEVVAENEKQRLEAEQVVYLKDENRMIAQEDVRLMDLEERTTVTGGHAEYDIENRVGSVTESPKLVRKGKDDGTSITIIARKIKVYAEEKRAVALENVHIVKDKFNASSGEAVYLEGEEKLILREQPEALQVEENKIENVVNGEQIEIALHNDMVTEVVVIGKARGRSVEANGARISEINGKKVTMKLEGEQLQQIIVEGNATSIYYSHPTEGSDGEMNEVSGDAISLFFRDGKIHRVLIKGGAMGTYYPSAGSAKSGMKTAG